MNGFTSCSVWRSPKLLMVMSYADPFDAKRRSELRTPSKCSSNGTEKLFILPGPNCPMTLPSRLNKQAMGASHFIKSLPDGSAQSGLLSQGSEDAEIMASKIRIFRNLINVQSSKESFPFSDCVPALVYISSILDWLSVARSSRWRNGPQPVTVEVALPHELLPTLSVMLDHCESLAWSEVGQ